MILYFTESLIKTITRVFRARNIAGRLASTSTTAISRNHARRLKRIAVKQNGKRESDYDDDRKAVQKVSFSRIRSSDIRRHATGTQKDAFREPEGRRARIPR